MLKSDKRFYPDERDTTSLLLVEGSEDEEVIGAAMQVKGLVPGFAISVAKGIANLKPAFSSRLKNTNILRKLWVIADADSDCNAKWQMLRQVMVENGSYDLTVKTPLPKQGAIFHSSDSNGITVGVWIMPDNEHPGMTEDFIATLVNEHDTLIGHAKMVTEALDNDRDRHPTLFRHVHLPKAIVHTWLSWQDKTGRSMGTAILRHWIDFNTPLGADFLGWLQQLQPDSVTVSDSLTAH